MHALRREAAKRVEAAKKRSNFKVQNPTFRKRMSLNLTSRKEVAIQTMPESYIFEAVLEQLKKKRKAGMYADIQ